MPDLLFQSKQERLPDGSPIIITRILGAIDGTTVRKFEEKLIGFFNQGVKNLILVFSDVKYINSTGMGLLVKLADKFQEGGGDIKLVGVPEKVIALFDMLGLLSLFKIYETEQDAIQSIMSEQSDTKGSSQNNNAMQTPPPPPPPEQNTMQTNMMQTNTMQTNSMQTNSMQTNSMQTNTQQGGDMFSQMSMSGGLVIGDDFSAGVSAPSKSMAQYPLVAQCVECQRSLEFTSKGNYKCPGCVSYITIDEFGQQSVKGKVNSQTLEVAFPCHIVYKNATIFAINSLAQQLGYSNVFCEEIKEALDNAISITVERSNKKGRETFHILAVADQSEMVIGLKALNPFLVPNGPKDARLPAIARKVDRLEVFPLPTKGQLLKIMKKRK